MSTQQRYRTQPLSKYAPHHSLSPSVRTWLTLAPKTHQCPTFIHIMTRKRVSVCLAQYRLWNHCIGSCALSHYFQNLYNYLPSPLIYTISISEIDVHSSKNSKTHICSPSSNPLYIPPVKTKAKTRAFSVAAPTEWNSFHVSVKLEGSIVSFRRRL